MKVIGRSGGSPSFPGFIVELSCHEMAVLAGVDLHHAAATAVDGAAIDLVKLCAELKALRDKKGFLTEQARQLRALAQLMDAVAPSFGKAIRTEDPIPANQSQGGY